MGLDTVEIVMEVEDKFNVKLPDSECYRMRTVADLAALVISRLPKSSGVCPTARSFYQVRRLLTSHAGIERRCVRPGALLADLIPSRRRRVWGLLRGHERRLPRLVLRDRMDGVLLFLGAIVCLSVPVVLGLWASLSFAAPLGALGVLAVEMAAFVGIAAMFRREFPSGMETVGDLARYIAPLELPTDSPGERLMVQQRVLGEVRKITSNIIGVPLEKVRPESTFVDDLGAD